MTDFFNGRRDDYGNNFDRRYGDGGRDRNRFVPRNLRRSPGDGDGYGRDFPPADFSFPDYPAREGVPPSGRAPQPGPSVFSMQNVVLYSPRNYSDVQTLIDHLRRREPAIVDFAGVADDSGQRVLDFLSGAIYALGGSMQRVKETIFLLTPAGITISAGGEVLRPEDRRDKR